MANDFQMKSYVDKIAREIAKSEKRLRIKAARHVAKVMRKNISSRGTSAPGGFPGMTTGNLRKGIKAANFTNHSIVGSVSPHAHLLEQGHEQIGAGGKVVGKVERRPFVYPALVQEADEVIKILSEKWVK